MLVKIIHLVKQYQVDIILVIGVILISLLSFAIGYIMAKQGNEESIQIKYEENTRTHSFIS